MNAKYEFNYFDKTDVRKQRRAEYLSCKTLMFIKHFSEIIKLLKRCTIYNLGNKGGNNGRVG